MPADQGLDADDAAGGQIVLGLVVEDKLLQAQGLAQRRLQGYLGEGAGGHVRGVELKAVAALVLGLVHGGIGVAHQGVDVDAVLGVEADADAQGDIEGPAVQIDGPLAGLGQLFGHQGGVAGAFHGVQDQGELIAPEAGERVALAHLATQAPRRFLQHPIPGQVSQAVIDGLEAVQIQEQQGHLALLATGPAQRLAQPVGEQ